jgi:Protein of unknown function (DUF3224)
VAENQNKEGDTMRFQTIPSLTMVFSLASWLAAEQMNAAALQTKPPTHAAAKVTVQSHEAKPYDEIAGPALEEINIKERFSGDIDGESTVRALEVQRRDRSATLVSEQRFFGKLGGRQGTFVLQGTEIVENGKVRATWFVVPGSGTDSLAGLRGEGGFSGGFGKGSDATLDYWFE